MRTDLDAFRYRLEREDASIHSLQRTMDRVVGELSNVQEGNEQLRTHLDARLAQMTRIVNSTKTDLEVKLVALETRFNRAQDELWGEETGLAKVIADLRITNATVRELEAEVKDIQCSKATVNQVAAVQREVNTLLGEANSTMSVLKHSVDTSLEDLKAHFKTATNAVAAHNSVMMQQVRNSYKEELDAAAKTRADVMKFIEATKSNLQDLERTQQDQNARTEEALRSIQEEVGDVGRMRKRDKNSSDVEQSNMKEQLNQVCVTSKDVAKALEHLSSVIWMVVQSEAASSALHIQDDSDRSKVALMGYKTNKQSGVASARSKSQSKTSCNHQSGANPQAAEDYASGPVISVDQRCLSCSGNAQTILSGFKMACLEYAPGPVSFAKKVWHRAELLDWRNKLLHQAHEALQSGPIEFQREDYLATAGSGGDAGRAPAKFRGQFASAGGEVPSTAGGGKPGTPSQDEADGAASERFDRDRPVSRASNASGRATGGAGGLIKMPPLNNRTLTLR